MAQNPAAPFSKWDETLEQLNYKIDSEGKLRKTAEDDSQRKKLKDIMGNENMKGFEETLREPLECALQREIVKRIKACGLEERYLPGKTANPPGSPSVPVMITPRNQLAKKNHVIVLLTSSEHGFCMFSYNYIIDGNGSIEAGSALGLAKQLQADGENAPGLIILNAGECIWSTEAKTNMSHDSFERRHFYARGKIPDGSEWDKKEHHIPGNDTLGNHAKEALENLVDPYKPKLSFIIVGDAILDMEESLHKSTDEIEYLGKYRSSIRSVAWVGRRPKDDANDAVIKDLRSKSQAYKAVKGIKQDFIDEQGNPTTREKTLEPPEKDANGRINVPLVPVDTDQESYVMPLAYKSVWEFIKNSPGAA